MKPISKHCKHCYAFGHTAFSCPVRPRSTLKTYSPMKKIGKVGKETAKAVARWKRGQKTNHEGYHVCYICKGWIPYLEAEHVKSKARHPDSRTDLENLKPVCSQCNERKGSHDG